MPQFKNCSAHPPGPPPARPPGCAARRPRCRPPAAHPLLPTHSRTVHFQSENALLIDFSKGNGLPERVGWKLCAKSVLRQFKNCVVHPPGPPPARPPGFAARRPGCRPLPAVHRPDSRTVHFQSENAPLIDFSKGNRTPRKLSPGKGGLEKNCGLPQFKNCVAHPPGPPPARPPGCCRPAAADPLLPTPCCSLPAAHSLLVIHTQKES